MKIEGHGHLLMEDVNMFLQKSNILPTNLSLAILKLMVSIRKLFIKYFANITVYLLDFIEL